MIDPFCPSPSRIVTVHSVHIFHPIIITEPSRSIHHCTGCLPCTRCWAGWCLSRWNGPTTNTYDWISGRASIRHGTIIYRTWWSHWRSTTFRASSITAQTSASKNAKLYLKFILFYFLIQLTKGLVEAVLTSMHVSYGNDSQHCSTHARQLLHTWLEDYETKLNCTPPEVDESLWSYASVSTCMRRC